METINISSPTNSVRYPPNDAASVHSGQLSRDQEEHRRTLQQIKLRLIIKYTRIELVDVEEVVNPPIFATEFLEMLEANQSITSMEEFGKRLTCYEKEEGEGQHYLDRCLNMPTFNHFTLSYCFMVFTVNNISFGLFR